MAKLKLTQIRSTIDRPFRQKRTMVALGLGKIRRSVVHNDSPQMRGMISAVSHLITVEEIN